MAFLGAWGGWLEWYSALVVQPQVQCERWLQASLRTFCPHLLLWDMGREVILSAGVPCRVRAGQDFRAN